MGLRLCLCKNKVEETPYVSREIIRQMIKYDVKYLDCIYGKNVIFGNYRVGVLLSVRLVNKISLVVRTLGILIRIGLDSIFDHESLSINNYHPILSINDVDSIIYKINSGITFY